MQVRAGEGPSARSAWPSDTRTSVSSAAPSTTPVNRQSTNVTRVSTAPSSTAPDRSQCTNCVSRQRRPVKRRPDRSASAQRHSCTVRSATCSGTVTPGVASGSTVGLVDVDSIGILVGTWVRGLGIVVAVAGIAATVAGHRSPVGAR